MRVVFSDFSTLESVFEKKKSPAYCRWKAKQRGQETFFKLICFHDLTVGETTDLYM